MGMDLTKPRWKEAFPYFDSLPLAEKRRFYSKAAKFLLNESQWDETLRSPVSHDHENMRQMLLAFNDHTFQVMTQKASPDIQYQWQIVRFIKKGNKRRQRKKQLSRLTYEIMQIIRRCHPAGSETSRKKDRVRCMSGFQKEVKSIFF